MCSERDSAKAAYEEARDSRSKEAAKLEKRMQGCIQEADEAEAEYKAQVRNKSVLLFVLTTEQIEQTNQFQAAYLTTLMPRVMEDLEKLEMHRYSGVRDQLKMFTNLLAALPSREANVIQPVTTAVNAINPDADVQLMIRRSRTDAKKPAPYVFEKDDINEGSSESGKGGALKKGKALLARKLTVLGGRSGSSKSATNSPAATPKHSIFGMKLEELMKRQENTAPHLEVPLPLVSLAWAMLKLGMHTFLLLVPLIYVL